VIHIDKRQPSRYHRRKQFIRSQNQRHEEG
jgi:hypothetical protein